MKCEELNTARLKLRKFEPNDLNFVYSHFSDKNISEFLYDHESPTNIDEAKELLDWCLNVKSPNHIRWCIIHGDNLKQIGTCGFHNYDKINNAAEIGYDISAEYWNQGYMSEALREMLNYGYDVLKLNRIFASVFILNIRSNKLLEKLGFRLEGIIRDKHLFRGKYYDHNLFSLLRKEKATYL
ncbi:GNAT family N-acetyltransferase [Candidatus Neomarinimicrobiota bacterium]